MSSCIKIMSTCLHVKKIMSTCLHVKIHVCMSKNKEKPWLSPFGAPRLSYCLLPDALRRCRAIIRS